MHRRTSNILWALCGVLALWVKLWLVSPHDIMVTVTPHDDLLFVNLAAHILNENWLGPYNQLTLIKGSFYSLFIALAYMLNIPLLTAQQLLQAGSCAVVVLAIRPLVRQPSLLLLLFLVLLFNPVSYYYPGVGRILQMAVYPPLGMLVLGLFVGLAVRAGTLIARAVPWALASGLALGVLWITRDESVWVVPSVALLLCWSLWNSIRLGRSWWQAVSLHVLPLATFSLVLVLICTMNYRHYGVFVRNELESAEFKGAYGGLLRIRTKDDRQYYPVVQAARRQGYAVSPSLREIEPYLEGDIGSRWQRACACPDIPAAFFIWALRDAVTAAGHHRNARETLEYYHRIGTEIDQACADGRLDCRPRVTSLMPPWRPEFNQVLLPTFGKLLRQIVTLNGKPLTADRLSASIDGWFSRAGLQEMVLFETITRERVLPLNRETQELEPAFHRRLNREKTRVLNFVIRVYQLTMPYLFSAALLVTVCTTVLDLRRRRLSLLPLCNWSLLAGILAIDAVITVVYITSYSEVGRAMTTAFPLVPAFVLVAVCDVVHRLDGSGTLDGSAGGRTTA